MTNKKPYLLFHGYKRFEKKLMPAPTQPLWTADYEQAESYIGDETLAGVLVMVIDTNKLKMLDIFDEKEMSKTYGIGINVIFKKEKIKSFYEFIDFLIDRVFSPYKDRYLSVLQKYYYISDTLSLNTLTQIYNIWKNSTNKIVTDLYTSKIFAPIASAHGYNCIVEHESIVFDDMQQNQYMICSNELIATNGCKFFGDQELDDMETDKYKTLISLDIYDPKSVIVFKQLLQN